MEKSRTRQLGDLRLRRAAPAPVCAACANPAGASAGVVQVDELAVRGVRGEGHRVRVGHRRGDHLLRRRLPRPHLVPVVLAGPARGRRAPTRRRCGRRGASARSSARRWASRTAAAPRVRAVGAQSASARRPARERRPEGGVGGPRVHVVEHAGDLHAGRGEQGTLRVALGHQHLPPQRRRDLGQVAPGPARSYGTTTGAGTSSRWASVSPLRCARNGNVVYVPVSSPSTTLTPPVGRDDQRVRPAVGRRGLPRHCGPVDPVRLLLADVGVRAGAGRRGRQQPARRGGEQPHLPARAGEVEPLVVGQVLGVALVDDVVQPGRAGGQRHPEHRPERVGRLWAAAARTTRSGWPRRPTGAGPSRRSCRRPADSGCTAVPSSTGGSGSPVAACRLG